MNQHEDIRTWRNGRRVRYVGDRPHSGRRVRISPSRITKVN